MDRNNSTTAPPGTPTPEPEDPNAGYLKYVNSYLIDMFEVMVLLVVFYLISGKKFDVARILQLSLGIALIMTFLNYYNGEMYKSIKLGMVGTIGGQVLSV